jgi:hypothetical protein
MFGSLYVVEILMTSYREPPELIKTTKTSIDFFFMEKDIESSQGQGRVLLQLTQALMNRPCYFLALRGTAKHRV